MKLLMIRKLHGRIRDALRERKLKYFLNRKRRELKNKDFSLISNNCIAGIIYHDLNLKFLTPTINLWIPSEYYIIFLLNLKEAISAEIYEECNTDKPYPVGYITLQSQEKIQIHFMHYKSFKEAKTKWDERKRRINWNNLFILFEVGKSTIPQIIDEFLNLPYKHKIAITDKSYSDSLEIKSLELYDDEYINGKILLYKPYPYDYKRYLDDFDYVQWLNE